MMLLFVFKFSAIYENYYLFYLQAISYIIEGFRIHVYSSNAQQE